METIAVVGNARSIFEQEHGELIDSMDTVVRFNDGIPASPKHQGTKTSLVVTYNTEKWDKIKKSWGDVDSMIVDPLGMKRQLSFHPSTLLAYLTLMDRTPGITIFGVDHNKTGTFYHRHQGYPHDWEKEKMYLDMLMKRNKWKKL